MNSSMIESRCGYTKLWIFLCINNGSSDSTFDSRTWGPWFESYTGLTWISQEIKLVQGEKLAPWDDNVCASLIFLAAVRWLHTKPGVKKFPQGDPNTSFLILSNEQGKLMSDLKVWLNGWIADSDPTKTGNCSYNNVKNNFNYALI